MSWHCKGEVFSGEDESGVGNSPYPRILDFLPPCWSCLRRTDVILCRELGWELKRSMELLLLSHFSCVRLCETPWMQPTRLPHPWDSPGKNTGVGCHFLLQCMKLKSESEVTQSCLTPSDPMDYSLPGSPVHGIFQARVLEWGAVAFSQHGASRSLIDATKDDSLHSSWCPPDNSQLHHPGEHAQFPRFLGSLPRVGS